MFLHFYVPPPLLISPLAINSRFALGIELFLTPVPALVLSGLVLARETRFAGGIVESVTTYSLHRERDGS